MKRFSFSRKAAIFYGSSLKSSVVSIMSTLQEGKDLNHFSCFSWIRVRQSNEISVSQGRMRLLVRWWHFSGVQRRQMTLVLSISAMDQKLRQRDLKTSYSASLMQPRSCISSEKTCLSARMLRSEILTFSGYLRADSCIFCTRVKMAQIWKVKPHRLGYMQYFSSMLIFFPLRFCHSATGYSIHLASGIFWRSMSTIVDFPQPMLPSMVKWKSFLGSSGLRTRGEEVGRFPAKNYINQIQNWHRYTGQNITMHHSNNKEEQYSLKSSFAASTLSDPAPRSLSPSLRICRNKFLKVVSKQERTSRMSLSDLLRENSGIQSAQTAIPRLAIACLSSQSRSFSQYSSKLSIKRVQTLRKLPMTVKMFPRETCRFLSRAVERVIQRIYS